MDSGKMAEMAAKSWKFVCSAIISSHPIDFCTTRGEPPTVSEKGAENVPNQPMRYAVSVAVVDRDGDTIVAIRGDNAAPHTMENARRKAYTAMSFKVATTDYAKRFADGDPVVRQQVTLPNVIA